MSSAYLRLLIFLPAILIPACASSSPAFIMMYSAYKLNKPGDNIHPCCTPLPVWNQSVVPCPVVTVASWPAYRFLWYSYLFQNFPQFIVIHKVKGFGIVNKADRINLHNSFRWDFHKFSLFFYFIWIAKWNTIVTFFINIHLFPSFGTMFFFP